MNFHRSLNKCTPYASKRLLELCKAVHLTTRLARKVDQLLNRFQAASPSQLSDRKKKAKRAGTSRLQKLE